MTTPAPFLYQRPGVYISETLTPLPNPQAAPGTAIAAFVGTHNMGPSTPMRVRSWSQFQNLYGGFGNGLDYLPFSVYMYFANGGNDAWVLRATPPGAVAARFTAKNIPSQPTPPADWVQTPTGTPFPGTTGVAPAAVSGIALAPSGQQTTALRFTWDAMPTAAVDGYRVRLENLGTDPTPLLDDLWVPQVADIDPVVTYMNLPPDSEFRVTVWAYQQQAQGADPATPTTFSTSAGNPQVDAVEFVAKGVGAYGNNIYVTMSPSYNPQDVTRFHLFVKYGPTLAQARVVETWQDVTLLPADPRYVVGMINSPNGGSTYISAVMKLPPATPSPGTSPTPDATWAVERVEDQPLAGGSDQGPQEPGPTLRPDLSEALADNFASIDDVLMVNLCGTSGVTSGVPSKVQVDAAAAWCQQRGRAFLVVDVPSTPVTDMDQVVSSYLQANPAATSWCAVYGPWVQVADPAGTSLASMRMLPAAGSVMGQYALADARVGPNRAAAGVAYPLVGAVGVEHIFSLDQLDQLNTSGINVVRPIPQAGYCIMGARTRAAGMPDRYVPIRRMLIYLEDVLERTTRYAIFEPNGPDLWYELDALVTQQLTTITQAGQLASSIPAEAFFVVCDETNNSPQTVANGEVHVQVGVALASPAEFIVINISQYQGGIANVDDQVTGGVVSPNVV